MGSTHFCHIWKATGLKGIVGVAVQEAGSEQSRAAGGAGGGEGGPLALIRRDHAGCEEERQREGPGHRKQSQLYGMSLQEEVYQ